MELIVFFIWNILPIIWGFLITTDTKELVLIGVASLALGWIGFWIVIIFLMIKKATR